MYGVAELLFALAEICPIQVFLPFSLTVSTRCPSGPQTDGSWSLARFVSTVRLCDAVNPATEEFLQSQLIFDLPVLNHRKPFKTALSCWLLFVFCMKHFLC